MTEFIDMNDPKISEHRKLELLGEIKEPLLIDDQKKYVLFPINHTDIWEMYKKAEAQFWTAEELDLSDDYKYWEKLSDGEKYFISNVLAFFASSDAIVNENLGNNFYSEIQPQEAKFFYAMQMQMENIHNETYNLIIDVLIKNIEEKTRLFNAVKTIPCIKDKSEWISKHLNPKYNSFAERILSSCILEGLFFSASFASIFWLKKRGILPGICHSNELISVDESLHTNFGCLIYSKLLNKLSKERVYEIFESATNIECDFIKSSIPSELIGMNSALMCQYVKFCADRLICALGYEKLYKVENPFDFIDMINLDGKANFFERKVSSYSKYGVGVDPEKQKISFTEEF